LPGTERDGGSASGRRHPGFPDGFATEIPEPRPRATGCRPSPPGGVAIARTTDRGGARQGSARRKVLPADLARDGLDARSALRYPA